MSARGRVTREVSLRDLPATLLDVAGSPDPEFPGISLAGEWRRSGTEGRPNASPAGAELGRLTSFGEITSDRQHYTRSLVWNGRHLIVDGRGREELYDIRLDPQERWDRSSTVETADVRNALKSKLESWVGSFRPYSNQ
jgi:arylsulfatase A-like enzyme